MGGIRNAWLFLLVLQSIAPPCAMSDEGVSQDGAKAVVSAVFDRLDCEMDGIIEPDEVDEHFGSVWLPADRDRSRFLSQKEYSLTHRSVPDPTEEALFRDADANADGKVVAHEFRRHLQRMIKTLDLDHNGEISRKDAGLKVQSWQPKRVRALAPDSLGQTPPASK